MYKILGPLVLPVSKDKQTPYRKKVPRANNMGFGDYQHLEK